MRAKPIMIPALSAAILLLSACASKQVSKAGVQSASEPHAVSLNTAILPVFTRSCGVCHKREGGNDEAVANKSYFETREDILARVGKFIIPGKPEESGLIKVLDQTYPVGIKCIPAHSGFSCFLRYFASSWQTLENRQAIASRIPVYRRML